MGPRKGDAHPSAQECQQVERCSINMSAQQAQETPLAAAAVERLPEGARVEARYPVLVLTTEGTVQGETWQLTSHTAFVRCQQPLRVYDITNLSITVSERESVLADAEVVWSNRYGPDDHITPRGMIVRFTNISARDRHRLHRVLVKHYQKKLESQSDVARHTSG
ncbi:MAG: PilZ domain-containing protein [Deltaproteobacteria bacterium]|nr:PilZ domain-containing protein [Deltaproteobacteria bacterium]MBW2070975.1 PilZ domain-containing protein [Deltaproteobacteria bacterium]